MASDYLVVEYSKERLSCPFDRIEEIAWKAVLRYHHCRGN
jgi:hypothetical protein